MPLEPLLAGMIRIQRLPNSDLTRIAEIDRREHVTTAYELRDGELHSVQVDWHVPPWFTTGHGDHHIQTLIEKNLAILEGQAGVLFGALHGERLVGLAILRPRLQGTMAQLSFLHVSQDYRRQGAASGLLNRACVTAKQLGARSIYVSATPSGSAVGFYLSRGFRPAKEPHPELYALEPEDIHMIKPL